MITQCHVATGKWGIAAQIWCLVKGTLSRYKRIFSNGSRMGILIFQSSMWAMWFCDITIIPLACAVLTCTRDRVCTCTFVLASEMDIVRTQKGRRPLHRDAVPLIDVFS